jgi:hypothetical protein
VHESLTSLAAYSKLVAELAHRPSIDRSTLRVWSDSPHTGIAEGEVLFVNGLRLRLREELDFAAGLITSYGYEVYETESRIYWYDDFPHPEIPELASTFPHHKHVQPGIRHNRIPLPG